MLGIPTPPCSKIESSGVNLSLYKIPEKDEAVRGFAKKILKIVSSLPQNQFEEYILQQVAEKVLKNTTYRNWWLTLELLDLVLKNNDLVEGDFNFEKIIQSSELAIHHYMLLKYERLNVKKAERFAEINGITIFTLIRSVISEVVQMLTIMLKLAQLDASPRKKFGKLENMEVKYNKTA
jgi:hypothetical protein